MAAGWFYSPEQIARYIITRPTSLKPPKTKLRNPINVLRDLDRHQWLMFSVGFLGWTWDAFDFFTVVSKFWVLFLPASVIPQVEKCSSSS
jgi:SHS family lactate transporter-like MFS transporter